MACDDTYHSMVLETSQSIHLTDKMVEPWERPMGFRSNNFENPAYLIGGLLYLL